MLGWALGWALGKICNSTLFAAKGAGPDAAWEHGPQVNTCKQEKTFESMPLNGEVRNCLSAAKGLPQNRPTIKILLHLGASVLRTEQ